MSKNAMDFPNPNLKVGEIGKFVEDQVGKEHKNYHGPSKATLKEMSTYVSELL